MLRLVRPRMLFLLTALMASSAGGEPTACAGDCDGDGLVTVAELIEAASIVLDGRSPESCPAADADRSGTVDVNELVLAVTRALNGCPTEEDGAVFTIRACADAERPEGQMFRVTIRDPAVIAEGEKLIGAGLVRIITGAVRRGDGGVNAPWSWHLDPPTIAFADSTIELCDGCPDFIDADLEYWVDTVGHYCPWSTEVVARER